jgi:hypothetical protein
VRAGIGPPMSVPSVSQICRRSSQLAASSSVGVGHHTVLSSSLSPISTNMSNGILALLARDVRDDRPLRPALASENVSPTT